MTSAMGSTGYCNCTAADNRRRQCLSSDRSRSSRSSHNPLQQQQRYCYLFAAAMVKLLLKVMTQLLTATTRPLSMLLNSALYVKHKYKLILIFTYSKSVIAEYRIMYVLHQGYIQYRQKCTNNAGHIVDSSSSLMMKKMMTLDGCAASPAVD